MFDKSTIGTLMCFSLVMVVHGQPSHISEIEEVIVSGSPLTKDGGQSTGIIAKVNRDDVVRQGGASLANALGEVPGVVGSSFTAGASRPVIRGFDANRVRILENGVGSFDVSDLGPDHGVPIDPLSTQSLEVVRGAATLRYGSQAIGGVVNAINNRVPLVRPNDALRGEFIASSSSNANEALGSALVDGRLGQFAVHADGFIRDKDDYATPKGIQKNSYFKGTGYALGSSYFFNGDESRVGMAGIHYDSEYGIPGDDAFIEMKQDKGLFGSSLAIDGEFLQTITIDAGYADYTHSEIDPSTGDRLATFNDREWDIRAESVFGEIGPMSGVALGLQAQSRRFSALGEATEYLLPTLTNSTAVFSFVESELSTAFTLQMSARVEQVAVEGTPTTNVKTHERFTPISAAVGLLVDSTNEFKMGVNVSTTARAPAQTELFSRGPHEGSSTYETGNPALEVERANSLELTLRRSTNTVDLESSLWVSTFDDFIYGGITGSSCDDEGNCEPGSANELKELIYDQQDALFRGLEIKTDFPVLENSQGVLSAKLLADYVRATFAADNSNIPRIPPYHIGGALTWTSMTLDAGCSLRYSAKQNDVPDTETPTNAFTSLNVHITWRPFSAFQHLEFSLVGSNLSDIEQYSAVALNKDEIAQPGRDIRFITHLDF